MLKEFTEAIAALAVAAKSPRVFRDETDPRKAWVWIDGDLHDKDIAPPLVRAVVDTIPALGEVIAEWGAKEEGVSVWYGEEEVVAILNNEDRREYAILPLQLSDRFRALQSLPKAFDQRSLILFLKRTLYGSIDESLLPRFRGLDFSKREEASSTVKHGEESLGRSIHAAVVGAADIPEFMEVRVPVYSNPGLTWPQTVRLSVDINVAQCLVELTPLPDQLSLALAAAQEQLGTLLTNELSDVDAARAIIQGMPLFLSWDEQPAE